ncbi:MAG: protein-glutamate O-methyltransferase CheR [Spirochaetales bacterium]|nr:protein-glutamate O-methyltransferase CheR [Spirochaetales bacterium]
MDEFLDDKEFTRFKDVIYQASGITFTDANRIILSSRLREILRASKIDSLNAYYDLITKDKEEMKLLLDSVTTNLTSFFRNIAQFNTLEHYVFPELIKKKRAAGETKIKIWSAGCSTGEEPYSIAMLARDKLPPSFTLEILASDLSLKCLMTAKEGYYAGSKISGIPDSYLTRFFTKSQDGYLITDEIKNLIKFDYHNLNYDSGNRGLDVVFCRNVIIYFDSAAQESVIEKFYNSMNNQSFLFIGHSESLFGMNTKFEFLKTEWSCIYQKKG